MSRQGAARAEGAGAGEMSGVRWFAGCCGNAAGPERPAPKAQERER